ncbi:MAG: serine/threonine protein kinase [Chloroflexi bacterium]|nr:serine/threonine protein kinase [Chloroflexota bacterium]
MEREKFNRYELVEEIGLGGMASVYRAYDPLFEREVALKILRRELLYSDQIRERFERETKIVARLEHPAIVPVYDVGRANDQLFFVMRYMSGGSLSERLRKGPLSGEEVIRIFQRIASALDYAHTRGIIHRDLKPGNILFDENGNAYISDFGIAKFSNYSEDLTGSAIIGTPKYISPEQAQGNEIDGRSDIYSLGVILFEMLSGRPPFDADTPLAVIFKHVTEPPPRLANINPDLPKGLQSVLDKALAKDRAERYGTAMELVAELMVVFPPADSTIDSTLYPAIKAEKKAVQKKSELKTPVSFFRILPAVLIGIIIMLLAVIAAPYWIPLNYPPTVSVTPSPTVTTTSTPSPTATTAPTREVIVTPTGSAIPPTLPTAWMNNPRLVAGVFAGTVIVLGLLGVWYYTRRDDVSSMDKGTAAPGPHGRKEEAAEQPAASTTMTTNLLAALDPKKRKELLYLIGRNPELRLKDKIVYYGGGRYILHGFGRFGATALIDQIVKIAEYEFNKLNQIKEKGIIMTIRIDAATLEEKDGEINGVIREFKFGAKHSNLARSFKSQMDRLYRNRLAEVNSSTDEKTVSVKAAPLPGIEAQFSRKFGSSSQKVSGDDLLKLVADFLDRAERQEPNSLDLLIDRVLGNTTLPARIIFVIDRIKSENVFTSLRRMRLFDDDRITFFGVVSHERYLAWKRNEEIMGMIRELKFQFHYVSCLWEEKTDFVRNLIENAFQYKVVGNKDLLLDFKDHIAFIARGAPGDAVLEALKTDYCEYPFGEPKLNLEKIGNIGEVKTNAALQNILVRNWEVILASRFKNTRDEEEDRARRAVYKLVDWIRSRIIFTLQEAQDFALKSDLRISDADSICLNILEALLEVLVRERYLSFYNGNYGVTALTTPDDIRRNGKMTKAGKKTDARSKAAKRTGGSKHNSSRKPV